MYLDVLLYVIICALIYRIVFLRFYVLRNFSHMSSRVWSRTLVLYMYVFH